MLHFKRRIQDINITAQLFKDKGYNKTASEILSFVRIIEERSLSGNQIPSDFFKKINSLFSVFENEFVNNLSIGIDYRKRCLQEIESIVSNAIKETYPTFNKVILTAYPLFEKLKEGRFKTGTIADELSKKRINDKNILFDLLCYAYLVIVEGIIDELARILYFLARVSNSHIPSMDDIEKLTVWDIIKSLGITPVFLENYEEKKHIRNAIGHARADYDSSKDKIHFVDVDERTGKVNYDKTLTLNDFMKMALELEDSVGAFSYIILLLRIYDLCISKDPYLT